MRCCQPNVFTGILQRALLLYLDICSSPYLNQGFGLPLRQQTFRYCKPTLIRWCKSEVGRKVSCQVHGCSARQLEMIRAQGIVVGHQRPLIRSMGSHDICQTTILAEESAPDWVLRQMKRGAILDKEKGRNNDVGMSLSRRERCRGNPLLDAEAQSTPAHEVDRV